MRPRSRRPAKDQGVRSFSFRARCGDGTRRVACETIGTGDVVLSQGGVGEVVDHACRDDGVTEFAVQL
jgi:hypothetical protein